jgi:hypothetical protein
VCVFIASKYEEIYPITLKVVYEKLGNKIYSVKEIKNKEIEILETLNFTIAGSTILDILNMLLEKILKETKFLKKVEN